MRAWGGVIAAVGWLAVAAAPAAATAPALSSATLTGRLTDPAARLAALPPGVRMVMPSSHDRAGGNVDGGSYGGPASSTGYPPPSYVRREGDSYVLMDLRGPGCLVRLFAGDAQTMPPGYGADAFGRLQLFFDGEAQPRFDVPAGDFFAGRDARYPRPLVGDATVSSGGNFAYVPFCFAGSLKVRTTSVPGDGLGWWQANVLLAPRGTPVAEYDPGASLAGVAARLARAGDAPAGAPAFGGSRTLVAGQRATFARLRGAGTVHYLRFAVAPFDIETLQALSLEVSVNRGGPQVNVPLGDVFGDGLEARPIHAQGFGMAPDRGVGYLALPIPYSRGAAISVVARRPAKVTVEGWRGPRAPAGAGVLHGERRVQEPALGADTRVLDARGSGRMASFVLEYPDGGPVSGANPLQRFLEGDERVHVDGARSPIEYGTGHEETSNGGFYFSNGAFSQAMSGAGPLGTRPDGDGTQSQYRVYADDGPRWSSAIAYGHEHGGGDEQPVTVAATTFSYRAATTLRETDTVVPGDRPSEVAHGMTAGTATELLTAYFEGEHDGNTTTSTVVAGGFYYPSPAADESPEGVREQGVRFFDPLAVTLRVARRNRGVVLRGLFDQAPPLVPLAVSVDGRPAGVWSSPWAIPNPVKRWLEDDFDLPPRLTAGRTRIRVTLSPLAPGARASLFGLRALSRSATP